MSAIEATAADGSSALLLFEIEQKRYALPAEEVVEILPIFEPTPMPTWPANALGIINVRGELLPLVDVAPLLGRPPLTIRASTLIVVVTAFGRRWGIVVDAVYEVSNGQVRRSEVKDTPGGAPSVMLGVTVEPSGTVVVVLTPVGLLGSMRTIVDEIAIPQKDK